MALVEENIPKVDSRIAIESIRPSAWITIVFGAGNIAKMYPRNDGSLILWSAQWLQTGQVCASSGLLWGKAKADGVPFDPVMFNIYNLYRISLSRGI